MEELEWCGMTVSYHVHRIVPERVSRWVNGNGESGGGDGLGGCCAMGSLMRLFVRMGGWAACLCPDASS